MVIIDGNRIICVTENEELKKKILELDPGDLVRAPLKPLPGMEIKIPYDSDAVADAKVKMATGINGVMEVYNSISTMPMSRDRQDITVLCKGKLAQYLNEVENNGKETLIKLISDLNSFVKPTIKEVLHRYA